MVQTEPQLTEDPKEPVFPLRPGTIRMRARFATRCRFLREELVCTDQVDASLSLGTSRPREERDRQVPNLESQAIVLGLVRGPVYCCARGIAADMRGRA